MLEQAPNGFFARDLMIFGSLDKGGIVAKGFTFEVPDFQNADDAELNRFHDQISLTLATLGPSQRLQVQWYCDSDYREELLRYREETARSANPWTRRCRNERFLRYWNAMKERKLRREKPPHRGRAGHQIDRLGVAELLRQAARRTQQRVHPVPRTAFLNLHGSRCARAADG